MHGHSSHHPIGIEVYRDRLILYGCGDLINDYEGIISREKTVRDLRLLYVASLESSTGWLLRLDAVPFVSRAMRLSPTPAENAMRVHDILERASQRIGTRFELAVDFADHTHGPLRSRMTETT